MLIIEQNVCSKLLFLAFYCDKLNKFINSGNILASTTIKLINQFNYLFMVNLEEKLNI